MILERTNPAEAAKNVFIKIKGILKSIAPLAPPLKPNHPNHKINAPSAAKGVLLPWKVLFFPSWNLPVLFPIINNTASATHPPTEWTTLDPAKSIKPNFPNQPVLTSGFEKFNDHTQCPTIG